MNGVSSPREVKHTDVSGNDPDVTSVTESSRHVAISSPDRHVTAARRRTLARRPRTREGDHMSNPTTQEAWAALGERLEALGLKLKLHVEQETGEAGDAATTIKESFERVGDALTHVFEGLDDAITDEAVRDDAKQAGRLLLEAVNTTFSSVADDLRDKIRR
jgi:hypothetical protein